MTGAVDVVHADDSLVVAVKPAGLLAVPGRVEPDCLSARVQALHPDALVVHRLDMATSGLMLFARGAEMQRRMSRAFAQRAVAKRYRAIVAGLLAGAGGEIDLPLGADWPNRPAQKVDFAHGKPSLTRWRLVALDRRAGCSELELEPVTGRAHQLRVHLLAIGHPVVGDRLYAAPAAGAEAPRLMLHAERLAFAHPADGTPVEFTSTPPFSVGRLEARPRL